MLSSQTKEVNDLNFKIPSLNYKFSNHISIYLKIKLKD